MRYEQLQGMLQSLEAEQGTNEHFELSSYEMEEAAAYEEYLTGQGYSRGQARKMAAKAVKRPYVASELRKAMNSGRRGAILGLDVKGGRMVAQFTIVATRDTANITEDLPFAILGAKDFESGYNRILNGFMPAGVTYTVEGGTNVARPNSVRFAYSDGVSTDNIDITCKQEPYPGFLRALLVDRVQLSKVRYGLSDATKESQFSQTFNFIDRTGFGLQNSNEVDILSFKSPEQNQDGIIDIDGTFEVGKETTIINSMIQEAGFSVTLSMRVEIIQRV